MPIDPFGLYALRASIFWLRLKSPGYPGLFLILRLFPESVSIIPSVKGPYGKAGEKQRILHRLGGWNPE